ncbi:MAG: DNA repair protein RecO [Chloroflexi bacterium]|nr:DNA repair protein RecO [Chloroflexota bacterium]
MRAHVYSTEGITLRRMDFGEADRILTVLTPFLGKVRLIAKGVRRPTSRMAGHVELFSHAQLQAARGRDLDVLTQASTIEPFRSVRENMVKAAHGFQLVELADGFMQDGDAHPAVFRLLLAGLGALAGDEYPAPFVARWYEIQLLAEVGYRPDLASCVRCRATIAAAVNGYSVMLGGALCPACAALVPDGLFVGADAMKLLRFLQRTAHAQLHPIAVPEPVFAEAEQVLRRHIEFALERRLRSSDFVRQVSQLQAGV